MGGKGPDGKEWGAKDLVVKGPTGEKTGAEKPVVKDREKRPSTKKSYINS